MDLIDSLNELFSKLFSKLLVVVVIGAPFAFLGGLVWCALPKDQAPVEFTQDVNAAGEDESIDGTIPNTDAIDDELTSLDTDSNEAGTKPERGVGSHIVHVAPIYPDIHYKSLPTPNVALDPKLRKSLFPSRFYSLKDIDENFKHKQNVILLPDFINKIKREDKVENKTSKSVSQTKEHPVEAEDATPVDTIGGVSTP